MKLLLLRHAEAVAGADMDSERELTPRGQLQAAAMALRVASTLPDAIVVSSPWRRARQTADHIAQLVGTEPVRLSELTPDVTPLQAAAALESHLDCGNSLVLVTHQPLCGRLISWLTEGRAESLMVAPCSGALLELEWPAAGMARLLGWWDASTTEVADTHG
jgi:phosphohistidine phosphatase